MTMEINHMSETFAQLFEESFASKQFKSGAIIMAEVVTISSDVVIVNAGLKSEAVIPTEQFLNEQGEVEVKVGDKIEVALESLEDGFGETRLSREKAKRARTWTVLEEAFEKGEIVKGIITGRVKGGFTVELGRRTRFSSRVIGGCAPRARSGIPGRQGNGIQGHQA